MPVLGVITKFTTKNKINGFTHSKHRWLYGLNMYDIRLLAAGNIDDTHTQHRWHSDANIHNAGIRVGAVRSARTNVAELAVGANEHHHDNMFGDNLRHQNHQR